MHSKVQKQSYISYHIFFSGFIKNLKFELISFKLICLNLGSRSKSRKSAKGAGVDNQQIEELNEEQGETWEDQMWEDVTEKDDKVKDEDQFEENEVSLQRDGQTHPLFKEKYISEARKNLKKKVKEVFKELKQFMYRYAQENISY